MKKNILLIEDDELLSSLLQTKLMHEGYEVMTAKNGEEGLDALENKPFDLILLDILMPRMNGTEFLKKFRAQDQWKDIPVIVISNSGEPFGEAEAEELGVADYLIKANFSPAEVIEKVKQQIGVSTPGNASEAPAVAQKKANALAGAKTAQAPKNGKEANGKTRLLVVEDDEFLRELIVTKLVNEGFEVAEAVDGEDGLRKIREEKLDLVLLDIILPSIDGFEVLKQIKADPSIASIPVVMLSNLGQQDDVERALSMGAKDYLIKAHFTPHEIVEKVKAVLSAGKHGTNI